MLQMYLPAYFFICFLPFHSSLHLQDGSSQPSFIFSNIYWAFLDPKLSPTFFTPLKGRILQRVTIFAVFLLLPLTPEFVLTTQIFYKNSALQGDLQWPALSLSLLLTCQQDLAQLLAPGSSTWLPGQPPSSHPIGSFLTAFSSPSPSVTPEVLQAFVFGSQLCPCLLTHRGHCSKYYL